MVDYFLFAAVVGLSALSHFLYVYGKQRDAYYRSRDEQYISTLRRLKARCERALTSRDPEAALEITLDEITDQLHSHNH